MNKKPLSCLILALLAVPALARQGGPVHASYLSNLPLSALIDELSLEKLGTVVVTGNKLPEPVGSITQQIEILNVAEFEQMALPHRNLADLLAYTSGQFVNVLSRNEPNWGSYAGLGPKHNTWLLDGMPVDSFSNGMSLPVWALEKVELHKGPASVLYASYLSMDFAGNESALAGTTNFILKDRIEEAETRFQLGAGSYRTMRGQAYHQNRQGNLAYFFGTAGETARYTNYGTADSWLHMLQRPDYRRDQFYGKLAYRFNRPDHTVSLFFNRAEHLGDVGRPSRDFHHHYDTINFAYANQLNADWHVQAKFGLRDDNRRFGQDNYPDSLASRQHEGVSQHLRLADVTASWRHFGESLLTFGIDGQHAGFQTYTEVADRAQAGNQMEAYSRGYFVQEKLAIGDWVLRAGLRRQMLHHDYALLNNVRPGQADNTWKKNIWSLGARYRLAPGLALYGNIGNSFVAPSANQMGGTLTAADAGVPGRDGRLPNLALRPEHGTGGDFGLDWRPAPDLALGLRAFSYRISDAIIDALLSSSPSQVQARNTGGSTSRGLEAHVKQIVSTDLQWFANLTLNRSRTRNPLSRDDDDNAMPFAPARQLNAGLTWQGPGGITVSPYWRWVGAYYDSTALSTRQRFGAYGTANLKLARILERNTHYTVSAAVELNNIGNRRYVMPWGFRNPGFEALASLQLVY